MILNYPLGDAAREASVFEWILSEAKEEDHGEKKDESAKQKRPARRIETPREPSEEAKSGNEGNVAKSESRKTPSDLKTSPKEQKEPPSVKKDAEKVRDEPKQVKTDTPNVPSKPQRVEMGPTKVQNEAKSVKGAPPTVKSKSEPKGVKTEEITREKPKEMVKPKPKTETDTDTKGNLEPQSELPKSKEPIGPIEPKVMDKSKDLPKKSKQRVIETKAGIIEELEEEEDEEEVEDIEDDQQVVDHEEEEEDPLHVIDDSPNVIALFCE